MGQSWEIVNPDCRETMMGGYKLGEVFFYEDWGCLSSKLKIPHLPLEMEEWLSGGREVTQTGSLAVLPTELLNLVLEEVSEDLYGLAAFAATCKRLLVVSKPYLLKALKSKFASWAGTRIVYLGAYTDDENLPPRFLTDEELDEVKNTYIPGFGSQEEYDEIKCYSLFATETYKDVGTRGYTHNPSLSRITSKLHEEIYGVHAGSSADVCQEDYKRFNLLCRESWSKANSPGDPVIFNLTKGECIQTTSTRVPEGLDEVDFTLTHLLLARICWSGREPTNNAMYLDDAQSRELGRGKWAGDRICISTLEDMPCAPDGGEWVDVTEEALEFVFHMWRHVVREDSLCATGVETEAEAAPGKRVRDEDSDEAEVDADDEQSQPKRKKT